MKAGRKPNPSLTIGVDCGSLSAALPLRGGTYTLSVNLLTQLGRIDKRNHYLLYSYKPIEKKTLKTFGLGMQNVVLPKVGFSKVWLPLHLKYKTPDIFLSLAQFAPRTDVPILGFIYDLGFIKYPQYYKNHSELKQSTDRLLSVARHIITTSHASNRNIRKVYIYDEKNIDVLYPGASQTMKPKGSKFFDKLPYFLYVGSLRKTKNIPEILKAFSILNKKYPNSYRMHFVGSDADLDGMVLATIKDLSLDKFIKFEGYVSEVDLPKYYRGAVSLVIPSIVEGLGLPILEAFACGVPVIAGNNSAMPEVVGKAGLLVHESNANKIAEAMETLVANQNLRKKLVREGFRRLKKFNNRRFAWGVLKCIYKYCV